MANQKDDSHRRVDGRGSSLDIFLFTNGQQESPPRKYNVRVNDRLDTTLNFLARSQNGSRYSIDLYTTEGKKVERAQELTDGAAYVAVEPPQAFVPAGYSDYLAKASRSREKRLEKIRESDSSITAKVEEENKDTTNIKFIQDITIQSASRTTVEDQDAVTNKVKSDIAKAVRPIKRLSLKPTQKRNNSSPQQNPPFIKRNTSNIIAPIRRGSNLSKTDATKKKVEISSSQSKGDPIAAGLKADSAITKTHNNSKDNESGVARVLSHTRNSETLETFKLLSVAEAASLPSRNVTGYKSTHNYNVDATVEERNILLPVTQENKPRESAYIIPIRIRSITDLLSKNKDSISKPEVKNVPNILNSSPLQSDNPQTDLPKGSSRTESKATFVTIVASDPFQKKALIYGNQTDDNSFAMFVKQGDIVNLQLNIEVKNVSNTTIEASHNHQVNASTPNENTPLIKFKTDTPNNLSGAKTYREGTTLTEPWLAGLRLPYDRLQPLTNDSKATPTTAKCNCCSCPKNPENLAPVYVDTNNYFIVLPPEDTYENLISCSCKLEINPQSKSETPSIHVIPRNGDNIVKLEEGKKTGLPVRPCNITELNESFKNNTGYISTPEEKQLTTRNESITEKNAILCECCMCLTQNQISVCECTQSLRSSSLSSVNSAAKQHPSHNRNIVLKDAFTQTDWSGVVLEARPLEDGCYAFHIPSIKLLKTTNSLYG